MRKLSLFLISLGLIYILQSGSENESGNKFALPFSVSAEEASEEIKPIAEMVQGDEDAPIELIEYASFTCPHCATFHADVYPELKVNYIDKGLVKFIYREVYFDKYGMWASMIARCAGPDKFFGMTDQIYRKQSVWSRAESDVAIVTELRKIGLLAGLDETQLGQCLQDGVKLRALVEWYSENAKRDEIKSTPTLVINGEKHSNQSYEKLTEILDEILEKS
jgi:protein-disulfide isomerase